jgi:hypothetical protein
MEVAIYSIPHVGIERSSVYSHASGETDTNRGWLVIEPQETAKYLHPSKV